MRYACFITSMEKMKRIFLAGTLLLVLLGGILSLRGSGRFLEPAPPPPLTGLPPMRPRLSLPLTPMPTPPKPSPSPRAVLSPTPHETPTPSNARGLPTSLSAKLSIADLFWLQDYAAAIDAVRNAIGRASSEQRPYLHFLLARALVGAKRYDEAERELETLLRGKPLPPHVPPEAYLWWARVLRLRGEREKAIRVYLRYARGQGALLAGYAWHQAAVLLRQEGRNEEALAAYVHAIARASEAQRTLWRLERADYLAALKRLQEALRAYTALLDEKSLPVGIRARALLGRAEVYARQDAAASATADLRAVLELAAGTQKGRRTAHVVPKVVPYAYRALILLLNAGQPVDDYTRGVIDVEAGAYTPAIPVLIRYLDGESPHHGDAHAYLARALAAVGNTSAAIRQWRILIDTHPECPCWESAWFALAHLYEETGQPARARALMRTLSRHPHASWRLRERARLFLADQWLISGRPDRARESYLRLAYEAQSPDVRNRAALLSAVLSLPDRPQAAEAVLQEAARSPLSPHWASALRYWLGKSALAAGDRSTARAVWQALAATRPTSWYAFRAAQQLSALGESVPPEQLPAAPPARFSWKPLSQRERIRTLLTRPGEPAAVPLLRLAAAYGDAGLDEQAVSMYGQAIQQVEDVAALLRLGRVLQEMGYPQLGIVAASRALRARSAEGKIPAEYWPLLYPVPAPAYLLALAREDNVDPALLLALIRQESSFATQATSAVNARGLMQLIPDTARGVARVLRLHLRREADLYVPVVNLELGAYYLSSTLRRFGGNEVTALAGYNAGPGNAARWRRLFGPDDDRFLELIPILETRIYLRQVQRQKLIYARLLSASR